MYLYCHGNQSLSIIRSSTKIEKYIIVTSDGPNLNQIALASIDVQFVFRYVFQVLVQNFVTCYMEAVSISYCCNIL
jgi:hypothetical protein